MKLSKAFGPLTDLRYAFQAAFVPTLCDIAQTPSMLLSPVSISRRFMAYVWGLFGNGTDEAARAVKVGLIPSHAYGIVLDIGAGHGHTADYLDHQRVTKYVALEPNTLMHKEIRARANDAGFSEEDGTLIILSYGAQDVVQICASLGDNTVDTLISVLTLCSIPSPEHTVKNLVGHVLKPGGTFLFYEHVRNPLEDVAWWQWFWTPLWKTAFDGCRLDRPTHLWIDAMPVWETSEIWGKEGEDEESLFWHRVGRFVKKRV
ncbi:S-adenosyl-L-methionine-dependent methyltransferase [Cristinia sonorae]|uniref:S-adenosyl-L-methionine-dependent methyltransferase n=1 Tax=Cristinia sonorae TaxID=1940300 RepID=A0A8K0UFI7_9AGAR|nr:S-adenosyl-L-methionine-dependent methyltransferase [Cristinia sonorae]